MLNNVIIMGNITKDLVLRHTENGLPVTSFTVAVDRDFGKEGVDFIDVVAWRNTAEFAAKYLGKSRQVVVTGSLQNREWTDKQGNRRRSAEIVADRIYFADKRASQESEDLPETFRREDIQAHLPF